MMHKNITTWHPCPNFSNGLRRCGTVAADNGESWMHVWIVEPTADVDDFGLPEGGGGAGQPYHDRPHVRRGRFVTVITQSGGLDI